jgi:hypothetical protein
MCSGPIRLQVDVRAPAEPVTITITVGCNPKTFSA